MLKPHRPCICSGDKGGTLWVKYISGNPEKPKKLKIQENFFQNTNQGTNLKIFL